MGRIVIGPGASLDHAATARPTDPAVYCACEAALLCAATLALDDVDGRGQASHRVVEPHGLLALEPIWYLLAIDHLRDAPRSLRLDRIRTVAPGPPGSFSPRDPRTLFPMADRPCGAGSTADP